MKKFIEILPNSSYHIAFILDDENAVVIEKTGSYKKFILNSTTKKRTRITQSQYLEMKKENDKKRLANNQWLKDIRIENTEQKIAELEEKLAKLRAELEELRG